MCVCVCDTITNRAVENCMNNLRVQSLKKAEKGEITLEEVMRVTMG